MHLREWRKKEQLTLVEAAPLFGLVPSQLSRLETGQCQAISVEMGLAIRRATKGQVTVDDLFDMQDTGKEQAA